MKLKGKNRIADERAAARRFRPDAVLNLTAGEQTPPTLLAALFALMPDRPRTTLKQMLKHGQIMLDGSVSRQWDAPVQPGAKIDVNLTREWQVFSHPRLKIVYEDDDIIVVDKGYGLLSMGNDKVREGTAYSILREYVKAKDPRNKLFVVHRLDQHTSGLMMFAKSIEAKETMQHNWNNMVIERVYAAMVEGVPEQEEGTIDTLLAENSQHVVYVTNDQQTGKRAVTRWRRVRAANGYALLDVSLDTGRKNQIRVHLAHIGHPIAGDRKYGAKTAPINRIGLHARTLRFIHPVTRRDMNFSIPLPPAMARLKK